jgi:hypothetical protein
VMLLNEPLTLLLTLALWGVAAGIVLVNRRARTLSALGGHLCPPATALAIPVGTSAHPTRRL